MKMRPEAEKHLGEDVGPIGGGESGPNGPKRKPAIFGGVLAVLLSTISPAAPKPFLWPVPIAII